MKRYQRLNPSYARIFIDHKRKKVSFHYPSKMSTFECAFNVFFNIWGKYFLIITCIALAIGAAGGGFYAYNHWDEFNNKTEQCDPTYAETGADTGDATIAFILAAIFGGLAFFMMGPPFIAALVVVNNEKLLRKFPDFCVKYRIKKDGGCHYVRKHKLDDTKFVIPLFENLFLTYKTAGEFKKYLENVEIKEYDYFTKWKDRKGKLKKEKNTEHWFVTFNFSKIPKKGYLEIHFI